MTNADLYSKLTDAIGAHGAWKLRLRMAAMKGEHSDVIEKAGDCHVCDFGRWLDGLPAAIRDLPQARETIELHASFHKCAGRIADMVAQGQQNAALEMLDTEFNSASNALKSAVANWKLSAA
jgi:hypothetical protein